MYKDRNMKMKKPCVIAILQQKGGAGKTTIATNLAHGLILKGYRTLLGDGDPQGSAREWHEANDAKLVPCVGLDRVTLSEDIKAVSEGYDIVIIDGAARLALLSAAAIRVADVILIPVQPSPYDVWATADLIDFIRQRQEVTDGKPKAAFIISRMIKNTNLSKEVIDALKTYGLPILNSCTTQYVGYAQSAAEGQSVFSYPAAIQARAEFSNLVTEIIECIDILV
jgi:chromosome partitioning protein